MKIAFVLDDTLDKPDGVQQYLLTLGTWLQNNGHEIHYLVATTTRTDIGNIHSLARTINFRFNGNTVRTTLPVSKKRIQGHLTKQNYDIIHVQMPYSPFFAGRVIDCAGPRTAVFSTFHILPYGLMASLGTSILGKINYATALAIDYGYSVSRPAAALCQKAFGLSTEVLPNVVNLGAFKSAKIDPVYRQKPTIVFLGRHVQRKGCHYLLRAIRTLHETKPELNFQVVIAGTGPDTAKLKAYVQSVGLTPLVDFVGFVSETEKRRLLASSDVAVFPSTGGESFGIVLIEAMASGNTVVLGGNNPGYASVLGNGSQQLFDPRDTLAFSEILETYVYDQRRRTAALQWQKQHIQQYDVAEVGKQLVKDYRRVLHSKRSMG